VERIPIELSTASPVNVLVKEYDSSGLEVLLNGRGSVGILLSPGDFPIEEGKRYLVAPNRSAPVKVRAGRRLAVPLELDGETLVQISPTD
jgi:hypothetical protein